MGFSFSSLKGGSSVEFTPGELLLVGYSFSSLKGGSPVEFTPGELLPVGFSFSSLKGVLQSSLLLGNRCQSVTPLVR